MSRFHRALVPAVLAVSVSAAFAGTELYGRPLRGLSAVSLAEIAKSPEKYRGKAIRVTGKVASASKDAVTLSEDGATLRVEADGSFSFPDGVAGASVAAEGKLKTGEPALVATGVEVNR